ncbi:MAG: hypothetical protein M3337_04740 [Actinomycetota bacterium]|nr:hypothetical protein [Actinomycetota bacterium]
MVARGLKRRGDGPEAAGIDGVQLEVVQEEGWIHLPDEHHHHLRSD